MSMEVMMATVAGVPIEVLFGEDYRLRFIGTDAATADLLAALVADDVEAVASSIKREPKPPGWTEKEMRAEVADRVAVVVRHLVSDGLVRLSGPCTVWRADFARIRQRLYGPQ